jgi:hypothetical protein
MSRNDSWQLVEQYCQFRQWKHGFYCRFESYVFQEIVQEMCSKLSFVEHEWTELLLCPVQCGWLGVPRSQNGMFWAILLVSFQRAWEILQIRVVCIVEDVCQAFIRGKQVNIASIVSCSVLVIGCAQKPITGSEYHHCSDVLEVWSSQWLDMLRRYQEGTRGLSPSSLGASEHSGMPWPGTCILDNFVAVQRNDTILKKLKTSESIPEYDFHSSKSGTGFCVTKFVVSDGILIVLRVSRFVRSSQD